MIPIKVGINYDDMPEVRVFNFDKDTTPPEEIIAWAKQFDRGFFDILVENHLICKSVNLQMKKSIPAFSTYTVQKIIENNRIKAIKWKKSMNISIADGG